ncbi:MAG: Flp pilus assembly complex ATPase component TadA, partial [Actinomycetota bacterium]|nr:Flp pilus assembly complex ATPase component TadA [Actinomycetota bacterium]
METTRRQMDALAEELRRRLADRRRRDAAAGKLGGSLAAAIEELVEHEAAVLSADKRAELVRLVTRETVGLGPLEDLLADPAVEEVMVNGPSGIYVERRGRIEPARSFEFAGDDEVREAIERILSPTGRRVDELVPMADARLADGSRVNVVVPPLAIDGPTISIRRFGADRPGPNELVESGSLTHAAAAILRDAVRARRTLLVTGGTGSGKTTLLNAISEWIDPRERVITIEDAAELRLRQPHVVRLEARPASVEGRGEVTIRDLLRNALRMRPDRIVVGEVRGAEALDLLTALNTGHDGALSTLHANSPADALRRLETLALMAGVGLPHGAVRDQVARGLDVIAHLRRSPDGRRRVAE